MWHTLSRRGTRARVSRSVSRRLRPAPQLEELETRAVPSASTTHLVPPPHARHDAAATHAAPAAHQHANDHAAVQADASQQQHPAVDNDADVKEKSHPNTGDAHQADAQDKGGQDQAESGKPDKNGFSSTADNTSHGKDQNDHGPHDKGGPDKGDKGGQDAHGQGDTDKGGPDKGDKGNDPKGGAHDKGDKGNKGDKGQPNNTQGKGGKGHDTRQDHAGAGTSAIGSASGQASPDDADRDAVVASNSQSSGATSSSNASTGTRATTTPGTATAPVVIRPAATSGAQTVTATASSGTSAATPPDSRGAALDVFLSSPNARIESGAGEMNPLAEDAKGGDAKTSDQGNQAAAQGDEGKQPQRRRDAQQDQNPNAPAVRKAQPKKKEEEPDPDQPLPDGNPQARVRTARDAFFAAARWLPGLPAHAPAPVGDDGAALHIPPTPAAATAAVAGLIGWYGAARAFEPRNRGRGPL